MTGYDIFPSSFGRSQDWDCHQTPKNERHLVASFPVAWKLERCGLYLDRYEQALITSTLSEDGNKK